MKIKDRYNIEDLREIMRILRGENGCPWDMEQDHHSIRKNFIEETYEVIEAIDEEDSELLCEELGDVLMQVMFHTQMEDEEGRFNFDDVCNNVCKKLIHRHPHVFSDTVVSDTQEVLKNWEEIKNTEKNRTTLDDMIKSVPKDLPALMRAQKMVKKTKAYGVNSTDKMEILANLKANIEAIEAMQSDENIEQLEEKIGKILWDCVNFSEINGLDCEKSLTNELKTYITRLRVLEQ